MGKVARHRWCTAFAAAAATVSLSVPAMAKVHFSVLYEFTGGVDGSGAGAALVSDPAGTLYGSSGNGGTATCGSGRCGSIFSLTKTGTTWSFATLYSLNGTTDGAQPANDQIVRGTDGSLYGTAPLGGTAPYPGGGGVVWKLTPSGGGTFTYSVLHSFDITSDPAGYHPLAGLAMDSAGVLYGTTTLGTANSAGAVFSLTPGTGGVYTEASLSTFTAGSQASNAVRAPTLSNNELRLFGPAAGPGVVFELHRGSGSAPWTYHTIAKFGSTSSTFSNLLVNAKGKLFGTVAPGGQFGLGYAFELSQPPKGTAQWPITPIANFGAGGGHTPVGPIVQNRLGQLFGTLAGNPNAIYELAPPAAGSTTWTASSVQNLDSTPRGVLGANGVYPTVGGALAGTTLTGGAANKGVVFRQSTH